MFEANTYSHQIGFAVREHSIWGKNKSEMNDKIVYTKPEFVIHKIFLNVKFCYKIQTRTYWGTNAELAGPMKG